MSIVYLAQPYTHKDPRVRAARFKIAEFMNAHYSNLGEVIYAPIVACHKMSNLYHLPTTADFWEKHNTAFLEASTSLRVLRMPGWIDSAGLKYEEDWWALHKKFVPIQDVEWKEIIALASAHETPDGFPLRYYLQILGANM